MSPKPLTEYAEKLLNVHRALDEAIKHGRKTGICSTLDEKQLSKILESIDEMKSDALQRAHRAGED